MSDTLIRFAAELKKRARNIPDDDIARDAGQMGSTETGWMGDIVVDWRVLDAEIDQLCAEFAARSAAEGKER